MIDVRKIQLNESVVVDTTINIAMPRDFDVADAKVDVVGRLTNVDDIFVLDAQANCQLFAVCSRCLRPVEHQLSFRINESFVEKEPATPEDIVFSDKSIDILPAVQRNLFPNIPMKLLCIVDCAGLCSRCGKNLNEGGCDCEGEINEQFRELLQFFED